MSAVGAVKKVLAAILIIIGGQMLGGIIAGTISGLGFITLQTAQSLAPVFSLIGITIAILIYRKVSG